MTEVSVAWKWNGSTNCTHKVVRHRTEDACESHFETHSFVKAVFFGSSKQATGGRSCLISEVPVHGRKL